MKEIIIDENQEKQRLDRFLKKYLKNSSLSYIYKIVRKDVKINGRRVSPEYVLEKNDVVNLYISDMELEKFVQVKKIKPVKVQFQVVYEDENILIVNKPKGILTHGDRNEKKNTLVNQVIGYLVDKGDYTFSKVNTFTPAPVNRLDRNTSGLVIFGKNNLALQALNKMMSDKTAIEKYYLTVTKGILKEEKILKDFMSKDEEKNKIAVIKEKEGGYNIDKVKDMVTIIRPLKVASGHSLIEVQLITGRTHQIRAHLSSEKLYIVGDVKYGKSDVNKDVKSSYGLESQFLHAYKLIFKECMQPLEYMRGKEIIAKLPKDLDRIKNEILGGIKNEKK